MFGVVYWSNVRRMWSVKTNGQKERFSGFIRMIIFHEIDSGQGSLTIGVILVLTIEDSPAQSAAIGPCAQDDSRGPR